LYVIYKKKKGDKKPNEHIAYRHLVSGTATFARSLWRIATI